MVVMSINRWSLLLEASEGHPTSSLSLSVLHQAAAPVTTLAEHFCTVSSLLRTAYCIMGLKGGNIHLFYSLSVKDEFELG